MIPDMLSLDTRNRFPSPHGDPAMLRADPDRDAATQSAFTLFLADGLSLPEQPSEKPEEDIEISDLDENLVQDQLSVATMSLKDDFQLIDGGDSGDDADLHIPRKSNEKLTFGMAIPEQPGDDESLIVDSEANKGAAPAGKMLEVEHSISQARPQAERAEDGHENTGSTVVQEPVPLKSLHSAPSSSSAAPIQDSPILTQQISTENPISRPAQISQPAPTIWVNSLAERLISRVTETHSNALNFTLFSEDLGNIDISIIRSERLIIRLYADSFAVTALMRENEDILRNELAGLGDDDYEIVFSSDDMPSDRHDEEAPVPHQPIISNGNQPETTSSGKKQTLALNPIETGILDIRI